MALCIKFVTSIEYVQVVTTVAIFASWMKAYGTFLLALVRIIINNVGVVSIDKNTARIPFTRRSPYH
jgi:hypothetical protein